MHGQTARGQGGRLLRRFRPTDGAEFPIALLGLLVALVAAFAVPAAASDSVAVAVR